MESCYISVDRNDWPIAEMVQEMVKGQTTPHWKCEMDEAISQSDPCDHVFWIAVLDPHLGPS